MLGVPVEELRNLTLVQSVLLRPKMYNRYWLAFRAVGVLSTGAFDPESMKPETMGRCSRCSFG